MKLFKNILYLSEGTVAEDASIKRAISLAESNQADLTVIDVVPVITAGTGAARSGSMDKRLQASIVDERRAKLEALIEPHKQGLRIRLNVLVGKKYLEAIRVILRDGHDLLIKPAENPGFIERLFGSDDMQLLRNCPCPVWLTRSGEKSKYEHILAAVDFDLSTPDTTEQNFNEEILGLSSSLALSDFAALHVIHVWDAPAEAMLRRWAEGPQKASFTYVEDVRSSHESTFDLLRQQLIERIGEDVGDYISPQFHLQRGVAATAIPEKARELGADLVVMGTVGRTGIAGWLIGNTAEAILEQLQCSVLAVKPPGFVSPVKLPK
ncbi:MAG TPA: universal stress protein [Woeseiaceae bacterium]|nr:universal stress protein [Woeseiaceae bacterium]